MWGGRLALDGRGYLYVTLGDRQWPSAGDLMTHPAQDLTNHNGATVRLLEDGGVPDDNPFVGRDDALPEIWTWGHRNAQGLAVHPETGDVWSNEHGPRGGDELNRILPGRNYGWPVASYGVNYDGTVFTTDASVPWMEDPRFLWTPSIGVSGLMLYEGDRFPWWQGNAFVGGLAGARLVRVTLNGDDAVSEETLLLGQFGRVRDVRQGPDGLIYLALERTNSEPSSIIRLEPVAGEVGLPVR